jgi:hypothetical protein
MNVQVITSGMCSLFHNLGFAIFGLSSPCHLRFSSIILQTVLVFGPLFNLFRNKQ